MALRALSKPLAGNLVHFDEYANGINYEYLLVFEHSVAAYLNQAKSLAQGQASIASRFQSGEVVNTSCCRLYCFEGASLVP